MEDKKVKAPQPPMPDIVGLILAPIFGDGKAAPKSQPLTPKSYQSPRDKQFRGGKNKGQ